MALFSSISRLFGKKKQDEKPEIIEQSPPPLAEESSINQDLLESTLLSEESSADNKELMPKESEDGKTARTEEACADKPSWQQDMLMLLRNAEPRLSVWLDIVLQGVDRLDNTLQERVAFLLTSLDVSAEEAQRFVKDFALWAEDMEYERLADFRGELQYRLTLALGMEDEEDERSRLFVQLADGLANTKSRLGQHLSAVFSSHSTLSAEFWSDMEEVFIMADMGMVTATKLVERLRKAAYDQGLDKPEDMPALLAKEIEDILQVQRKIVAVNAPEVQIIIGVNGVGKTTTIAKLAYRATLQGKKVMLAGADTFRAAATEQLGIWAKRVGAGFHTKGANADPAAVAYESTQKAVEEGFDLLIIDTAGRLHTKVNLMEELKKIHNVVGKRHEGAPHSTVLIVDATTGQNALQQVKLFNESTKIDSIILTKLDGTAKGGIAIAIALEFGIPITYVGLGEKMEDLRPFDAVSFAKAIL